MTEIPREKQPCLDPHRRREGHLCPSWRCRGRLDGLVAQATPQTCDGALVETAPLSERPDETCECAERFSRAEPAHTRYLDRHWRLAGQGNLSVCSQVLLRLREASSTTDTPAG